MIYLKNNEEIEVLRQGGEILSQIMKQLVAMVKPETRSEDLENKAIELIEAAGGRPAFKGYDMGDDIFFPTALCLSLNNEVVHGDALPGRVLKAGDIADLDLGMEWPVKEEIRSKYNFPKNPHSAAGGYYTDMCLTVPVGKINQEARKLLKVTKLCLEKAINEAKPGKTLNDIGRAVEEIAEQHGYGVVRDLVGHGVGYFAHEDPNVANYRIGNNSKENIVLEPGMVIAIEPMINQGSWKVKFDKHNGYTVLTADGSLSAHFEHSVAITEKGNIILTK